MVTVLVGAFGLRISRTTSDFYVASRTVGPRLNAAAISGEYLSAASFLGIAGLVLVQGPDMLWYPVGYTAGYLVLLLFVAAPCAAPAPTPSPTSPRPASPHTPYDASREPSSSGWAGCTCCPNSREPGSR